MHRKSNILCKIVSLYTSHNDIYDIDIDLIQFFLINIFPIFKIYESIVLQ